MPGARTDPADAPETLRSGTEPWLGSVASESAAPGVAAPGVGASLLPASMQGRDPVEDGSKREGFRPEQRVRRSADYKAARHGSRRVHTPHFLILVRHREPAGPTRLGITVTKRVAPAVGRNRIKRVWKEVFRRNPTLFPEACDVIVIARAGAAGLGYWQVLDELRRAQGDLERAARQRRSPEPARGTAPRRRGSKA